MWLEWGWKRGSTGKLGQPRDVCSEDICGVSWRWGLSPSLSGKAGFGFVFGLGLGKRKSLEVWLEWCSKW